MQRPPLESVHTLSPNQRRGLPASHVVLQEWLTGQGPSPQLDQVVILQLSIKIHRLRFLCCISFVLPHPRPPSLTLCLLTQQAYPAPFIFRILECLNKTFVLCSCAHDWENQNHKGSYDHDDLDGYATNNSR